MKRLTHPILAGLALSVATTAAAQTSLAPDASRTLSPVPSLSRGVLEAIDFEGLVPGTIVSEVFGNAGTGPIQVNAMNPSFGDTNAAVIFDSANPTGEDEDLGTPNEDFGGPGIGENGGAGSPFANNTPLGHLLIVAEDLVDANNDDLIDDPDDADRLGAPITFDFAELGSVTIHGLTLIDVEADEPFATADFYEAVTDILLGSVQMTSPGDNGVVAESFEPVSNVGRLVVTLNGSGGIDNVLFTVDNTTIGDTVFCDIDDDGEQDADEPGIPGVQVDLTCAGPDGLLDTADDFTDSRITDANGNYLFDDQVPGLCRVQVVLDTAPSDKVLGRCPEMFMVELRAGEAFLDGDFCFIAPGEIGDTVYCDIDNDGMQDDGEPGIPGVEVRLACAGEDGVLGTGDDVVLFANTDANGQYLFEDVLPGDCVVTVNETTVSDDKMPGECPLQFEIDLMAGDSYLDADFCFVFVPGEIGDMVYLDRNDNGMQEPDDPGIPDVRIQLTCAGIDGIIGTSDDLVRSETTDGTGFYLFNGVPPGPCLVEVDESTAPPDNIPGQCPPQVSLDLPPGGTFLAADFCFTLPQPAMVGDSVFCDDNDNGILDLGDSGISGVLVEITCAGPDGELFTADDIVDSQSTDGNGNYLFENVPAGLCEVTVDVLTVPADKEEGQCPLVRRAMLMPGQAYLDADFCFRNRDGEIGDTVFCDNNNNGVQDDGEPGIGGVTVELTCAGPDGELGTADDLNNSVATDSNGNYLFLGVPPGLCEVRVDESTAPADKVPGRCPTTFEISLAPGQSYLDADSCFIATSSIGDLVWCDINNDGIRDRGEPGIPGIFLDLHCAGRDGVLGTDDDVFDRTRTNRDGLYLFSDLIPGPCTVAVDLDSVPDVGAAGECPVTLAVALQPGQSFLDADFCFYNTNRVGEGCPPEHWEEMAEADSWPRPFEPDTLFSDYFEDAFPGMTLQEVLKLNGGSQLNILGRETVAALLNAAAPGMRYGIREERVIAWFDEVYVTKRGVQRLTNYLRSLNAQGCP